MIGLEYAVLKNVEEFRPNPIDQWWSGTVLSIPQVGRRSWVWRTEEQLFTLLERGLRTVIVWSGWTDSCLVFDEHCCEHDTPDKVVNMRTFWGNLSNICEFFFLIKEFLDISLELRNFWTSENLFSRFFFGAATTSNSLTRYHLKNWWCGVSFGIHCLHSIC